MDDKNGSLRRIHLSFAIISAVFIIMMTAACFIAAFLLQIDSRTQWAVVIIVLLLCFLSVPAVHAAMQKCVQLSSPPVPGVIPLYSFGTSGREPLLPEEIQEALINTCTAAYEMNKRTGRFVEIFCNQAQYPFRIEDYSSMLTENQKNNSSFEIEQPDSSGKRWYRLTVTTGGNGRSLILVKDITGQKNREQDVLSELYRLEVTLTDALEAADKARKAKNDFLSSLSHEICTPINAIISMGEMALKSADSPDTVKEYLGRLEEAFLHLLSLLDNIMDISRVETGRIELAQEPFRMEEVVSQMAARMKHSAQNKDIDFIVESRGITAGRYLGDRLRLCRILLNLLSNAFKYTEKGGKIFLEVEENKRFDKWACFSITVTDTGIGMSQDFLTRIFEPFEQESNAHRSRLDGTGLGLSITKNFVNMMGGQISVQSTEGAGSVFRVELQFLVDGSAEEKSTLQTQTEDGNKDLSGTRILVAEDNDMNYEIIQALLEERNIVVYRAKNGEEAVKAFEQSDIQFFQVILMDIMMPVMNGLEASKKIRNMNRGDALSTPIIAVSANAFREDMVKSLSFGMNDHLAKPVNTQRLYEIIAACVCRP